MKATTSRAGALGALAVAVLLVFATTASAQNKCHSGKIKCASKKMAALLKCHIKAEKDGLNITNPDIQECITKALTKFDGNQLVPAEPDKGCMEKLEGKDENGPGPVVTEDDCVTFDDTDAIEAKVDAFVDDVVRELDPGFPATFGPNKCSSGKKKCVLKKTDGILKCHIKLVKDPTFAPDFNECVDKARQKFSGSLEPEKGCFAKLEGKDETGPGPVAGEADCVTFGDWVTLERKVDLFITDLLAELDDQQLPLNNHRCTGNTRRACDTVGDCAGVGGTCEFFFGTHLPLSAGGVSTCVMNQFTGSVTGTANIDTGSSAGAANLISRVFSGTALDPCPRCVGDAFINDGIRGGTCNGGQNPGASCDANGTVGNAYWSPTSFDCPPAPGANIANLPIDLANTTGIRTVTLAATNPNCRAVGFTGNKCFCDTCSGIANNGGPCDADADCPGGTCGGARCLGGGNVGAVCTVNSECPASACGRPGAATKPNECDDATCSATISGEGECAAGPVETYCGPNATNVGCLSDLDCSAVGAKSCVGGPNSGAVCTVASQCPGGACNDETCSITRTRECFTDNGTIGNSVTVQGIQDTPVNHASDPTLATAFCIAATSSPAVNAAAGLPALGRVPIRGHATDDATDVTCPSIIDFSPNSGFQPVLDPGWTGQGHDAAIVQKGTVTVSVTGCAGAAPTCGVCNYTGPIANPGAPSAATYPHP